MVKARATKADGLCGIREGKRDVGVVGGQHRAVDGECCLGQGRVPNRSESDQDVQVIVAHRATARAV